MTVSSRARAEAGCTNVPYGKAARMPRAAPITNEPQVEDDENVADRLADEAVLAMVKVPDTRRSGPGCRNREWASEDHRGRRYPAARSILWRYASWATHHQHLCRIQDRKR